MPDRDVVYNIRMNDEQFQRFVNTFEKLQTLLTGIDEKWKKINESINKSARSTQQLSSVLASIGSHVNRFPTTIDKVTKSIFKWGALISGIGMLLGGGGMFGLGRMSENIIARQRFMMGIGGQDYMGVRTAQMIGGSVLQNPSANLEAIATGQTTLGSKEWLGLNTLGLSGRKETPEQLLPMAMERLPETLKRLGITDRSMLGNIAGPMGLTNIFSMQDLLTALEHPDRWLKQTEEIKKRQGKVKPEDLDAWTKFWDAVKNYGLMLETQITSKLAPLAKAMTPLTENFTKLTEALLDLPAVQRVLNKLSEWMTSFGQWLGSDPVQKNLKEFVTEVVDLISKLYHYLGDIVNWLIDKYHTIFGTGDVSTGGARGGTDAVPGMGGAGRPGAPLTLPPQDIRPPPRSQRPQYPLPDGKTTPPTLDDKTTTPPTPPVGSPTGPLAPFNLNAPIGPGPTPSTPWLPRNYLPFMTDSTNTPTPPFPPTAQTNASGPPMHWSASARSRLTRFRSGGSPPLPSQELQTPEGPPQSPYGMNQWQTTRTASLVVRGIPSANTFLTANAMT